MKKLLSIFCAVNLMFAVAFSGSALATPLGDVGFSGGLWSYADGEFNFSGLKVNTPSSILGYDVTINQITLVDAGDGILTNGITPDHSSGLFDFYALTSGSTLTISSGGNDLMIADLIFTGTESFYTREAAGNIDSGIHFSLNVTGGTEIGVGDLFYRYADEGGDFSSTLQFGSNFDDMISLGTTVAFGDEVGNTVSGTIKPIPEPATGLLLLLPGLIGMIGFKKRELL